MIDAVDMDGHVPFIFEQQFHTQSSELEELTKTEMDSCNGNVIEIKPIEDEIKDERVFDDVNIQPVSNIDANVAIASISTENELNIPQSEDDERHIKIEGSPEDKNDKEESQQGKAFSVDSRDDEIVDIVGYSSTNREVDFVGCSNEEESSEYMCVCTECGKAFKKAGMSTSKLYHKNRKKVKCTVCGEVMPSETGLSTHMTIVHGNCQIYACGECGDAFTKEWTRTLHKKRIHNIIPKLFPRKPCGKVFKVNTRMRKHMQEQEKDELHIKIEGSSKDMNDKEESQQGNAFGADSSEDEMVDVVSWSDEEESPDNMCVCEDCRTSKGKGSLRRHMLYHRNRKKVKCTVCGKRMSNEIGLSLHMTVAHSNCRMFACGECGEAFTKERERTMHKKHVHNIIPDLFPCKQCGKGFKTKTSLTRHMQEHREVPKRYPCDECDMVFSQHKELTTHSRCHNPERLTCTQCGVNFRCYSDQRRHLRAHSLGKFQLYPCGVCDKVYEKESRLRHHWRYVHGKTDSWVKKSRCKICKITLDRNDMARHMETHYRDQRQSQEGLEMSLHHACEICGEEFERRSQLHKHSYAHSVGYCNICEVRFPTPGSSREHTDLNPGHTVILLAKETDPTPPAKTKDSAVVSDDLSSNHTDMTDAMKNEHDETDKGYGEAGLQEEGREQLSVHHVASANHSKTL